MSLNRDNTGKRARLLKPFQRSLKTLSIEDWQIPHDAGRWAPILAEY